MKTTWLLERAARTPDAPALSLPDRDLSWSQLAEVAMQVAARLSVAGVDRGDVVALLLSSRDFPTALHAAWLCGAVVLPLNLRLSAAEMAFQLRDAGAVALLHGTRDSAERAAALASQLPLLRVVAELSSLPTPPAASVFEPPPAPAPDESAAILYTSGTTGRAKGAVLTAANFLASARASERQLGSGPTDRCLACMPLFHVGGLSVLARSLMHGSCVQVQDGFDADAVAAALDADGITDVSFVANMLARVLDARGDTKSPPSLRNALVGGGPVPESLLARARSLGYPVAPTYGLTEATSQVATRAPADDAAIGLRPLPGVEIRIQPTGEAGDEARVGEILVRGDTVMAGYLNRPEATARALDGGWLHTGDIGLLHDDGTLTVLDRRSDLIVSGGENVYPAEIESVLLSHEDVAEAGVGRRDDERFGARPVAWWVPVQGRSPSDEALAAFCRDRLAPFKVPVAFHAVTALPRTAAGKLKRFELVEPEPPSPGGP